MIDVRARLIAAGMSAPEAERKRALIERANEKLLRLRGADAGAVFQAWVPGRIEMLGKHTDYAGGRSLLCAAERGICVVAAARRDDRLRVHDVRVRQPFDEPMLQDPFPGTASPPGHWSAYVAAVARRVVRNFGPPLVGADIVIAGDLPQAAGMSSSSALVIAIFHALSRVNQLELRDAYRRAIGSCEQLAEYMGTVENGQSFGELSGEHGVGTFGGSEDHTAILCARADALVQYGFCPVRLERAVPFPKDHVLVVATSGVVARKTGGARHRYNRLSKTAAEIVNCWQNTSGECHPTLAAAVHARPTSADDIRRMLQFDAGSAAADMRLARFEHFVLESEEIIPAASEAIAQGKLDLLGTLVDRSQAAAARLLMNQVPETSFLARIAREMDAVAASAFGAGFGGSVWALVPEARSSDFAARWSEAYTTQFAKSAMRSEFFVTKAGPALTEF